MYLDIPYVPGMHSVIKISIYSDIASMYLDIPGMHSVIKIRHSMYLDIPYVPGMHSVIKIRHSMYLDIPYVPGMHSVIINKAQYVFRYTICPRDM